MERITYKKILQAGNWVGYSDEIAKKFKCVLTSCLISFFLKKESDLNLEGEWFYVTQEDVEKKLFIGEKPFFKMRNLLVNIGVFEIKYDGVPRRCYYRIPDNFIEKINDFDFCGASNSQMEELKKYSPISPNGRSKQLPLGGASNSQMEEHSYIEYNNKNIYKESNTSKNQKKEKNVLCDHELLEVEGFYKSYPEANLKEEKSCVKKEITDDLSVSNLKDDKLLTKDKIIQKSKEKTAKKGLQDIYHKANGFPELNEDGFYYSFNEKGEKMKWFGFEDYLNVCFSEKERIKLRDDYFFDQDFFDKCVKTLSIWKFENPDKAKKKVSDYLCVLNWVITRVKKDISDEMRFNNPLKSKEETKLQDQRKLEEAKKMLIETMKKYE